MNRVNSNPSWFESRPIDTDVIRAIYRLPEPLGRLLSGAVCAIDHDVDVLGFDVGEIMILRSELARHGVNRLPTALLQPIADILNQAGYSINDTRN